MEELFANILKYLPADIYADTCILPFSGEKPLNRIKNTLFANRRQAEINHITGDINFIALAMNPETTILTIHDVDSFKQKNLLKNTLIRLLWLKWPIKRVKAVTVISENTKTELLKYISAIPEKIHVIPNPLSPAFSYTAREYNSALPSILHIGTKENKNLERLIPALQDIKCHLRIIGVLKPHQHALLIKHNIDYSNAYNLSFQQIVEEYRNADLISFVSLYEGFGMPIIEAQATGRPVITSNCSAMPEVAGKGALLVDPTSINDIREGILRLLADESLRAELIEKGLENVKKFDVMVIAEQYAKLYRKIAAEA